MAEDIIKLVQEKVTEEQLHKEIETAIKENKPEEARMYINIGETFNFKLDKQEYIPRIQKLEGKWQTAKRKTGRFFKGFLKGKSETKEGVAGAIISDFTVIGDVRDLKEQHELYKEGKEVNKLIVTLAGVGVGLTATSLISTGTTAPIKSGVSTLKIAAKSGKLTPKMQKILLKQGKDVFDQKRFFSSLHGQRSLKAVTKSARGAYSPKAMSSLKKTAESMNSIRKSTSLSDTVHLLKFVENTDDLRRIEKVSLRYGKQTKGIFKLVGKAVIGTIRVLRLGTELILSLIFLLISSLWTIFSFSSFIFKRSLK